MQASLHKFEQEKEKDIWYLVFLEKSFKREIEV
jgi:hypothetical protein